MVIICRINDKEINFNTIEEMYEYNRFNEITYIDCKNNEIKELKDLRPSLEGRRSLRLPSTLQILWCNDNEIEEIKNFPTGLQYFDCYGNLITEIKNLPDNLRYFDCEKNQITEIKNLPTSLRCFYYENNPITNPIEIKKWQYICQRNRERDEYMKEHFSVPSIGIELGGFSSFLLIPPIENTLSSLLYL